MDSYSDLLEKMNEQESSVDVLMLKIAEEIEEFVVNSARDFWFNEDIKYSEYDVLNWLKENRPEFYKKVLEQPEIVEGSDTLIDALRALDLMKDWAEVRDKDIQTPEEEEQRKGALRLNDED